MAGIREGLAERAGLGVVELPDVALEDLGDAELHQSRVDGGPRPAREHRAGGVAPVPLLDAEPVPVRRFVADGPRPCAQGHVAVAEVCGPPLPAGAGREIADGGVGEEGREIREVGSFEVGPGDRRDRHDEDALDPRRRAG
jgi:hypothetical protein